MAFYVDTRQATDGGRHYAIIYLSTSHQPIGKAVYDPARKQFAFVPQPIDRVLSAADVTAIVTILNGLSV